MARKIIIILIVGFIGLGSFLVWNLLSVPMVSYVIMKNSEALETLLVSGRVVGEDAVPLSFKRPGQVVEVVVSEGDQILSNDLIARLDDSEVSNLINQSENKLSSSEIALSRLQNRTIPQARENLTQAETKAEIAKSIYQSAVIERLEPARNMLRDAEEDEKQAQRFFDDQQRLYEGGSIDFDQFREAEEEWERALDALEKARKEEEKINREIENLVREKEIANSQMRAAKSALQSLEDEDLRQARISVEQAQAELEQSRFEMEQTRLEAPFPGLITKLAVSSGQYVNLGQEVCIIIPAADTSYIEAQVDEEFAGKLAIGQGVTVSSTAFPDRLFTGKVEKISPTIDPERGTFQARFALDKLEADLLPDLAVSAEVVTGSIPDSLIIEQSLTFREDNRVYVLIENDGRVARRQVVIEDLGSRLFLVTEGLSVGEKVLVDLSLEEGRRIRLGDEVFTD